MTISEYELKKELLASHLKKTLDSADAEFMKEFVDSIDIEVILDKMVQACDCTFEELVTCDQFLSSDVMKRYNKALSSMAEVFMREVVLKVTGEEVVKH